MQNEDEVKLLIKKCKKGDMIAFDNLMRLYQASVFGYVYKLCNNYEDANDITNETFIKLLSAINTFDEKSRFKGWLFTIAKNIYIDKYRAKKNHSYVSIDEGEDNTQIDIIDDTPNPEAHILDDETNKDIILFKEKLSHYIDELPVIQREPIKKYFLEGKSYEEISLELNVPKGTLKSRINRAKEKIKERFVEDFGKKKILELPFVRQSSLPK